MTEMKDKIKYKDQISKILALRFLTPIEQEEILKVSDVIQYSDGEKIIKQGELSKYFFCVLEGTVVVNVDETSSKNVYICAIGEGEVFGEAGMFLKVKRTANVDSSGNAIVLRIERTKLIGFIKKEPKAGIKILMIIIYSLLRKLKEANLELAFERKVDIDQESIDSFVDDFLSEN